MKDRKSLLRAVARAEGICTAYTDMDGHFVHALEATLAALYNLIAGQDILDANASSADLSRILKRKREGIIARGIAPYLVQWGEKPLDFWTWVPSEAKSVELRITAVEGGERVTHELPLRDADRSERHGALRVRLRLDAPLKEGYHTLEVVAAGNTYKSFIICAPDRLEFPPKGWGIFMPTHVIPPQREGGLGGLENLGEAAHAVAKLGGSFLGMLPILAALYKGADAAVSPYSPSSRLFFNEIYLDLDDVPGAEDADLEGERKALKELTSEEHIDYLKIYEVKQRAFRKCAALFKTAPDKGFDDFVRGTPNLEAFADFQAGKNSSEEDRHYHAYLQYILHLKLRALKEKQKNGQIASLYMDFPVGVHAGGFDATHFEKLFIERCEAGSPPDPSFKEGQKWGFRPFHPRWVMDGGFEYFRQSVQAAMRYSGMLRIDHIMGLFRIYCVPDGISAKDGAYVYLPFSGLLAILCYEAKRQGVGLIGEDLGHVSPVMRDAMERRGLIRMWLLQFQAKAEPAEKMIGTIEENMIVSFNSHDSYPFRGFVEEKDIEKFHELGLMNDEQMKEAKKSRKETVKALSANGDPYLENLKALWQSPARLLLISGEDVFERAEPQNIPGTDKEYPNWKIRMPKPIADWEEEPTFKKILSVLTKAPDSKQ